MKNSNITWLMLVLLSILFFVSSGCGGGDKPSKKVRKENIYIVLCDLTTSLDSNSVNKVANLSRKVFEKVPNRSKVFFFEIDDNAYRKPFFESEVKRIGERPSETKRLKSSNADTAKVLEAKIIELGSKSKSKGIPKSCILRSLKKVDSIFLDEGDKDTSKYNYWIVILSDMLEECLSSPLGETHMKNKYKSQVEAAIENYQPDFNLGYANIRIGLSSENNSSKGDYLRNEELEEVWKKIFLKLGQSEKQLARVIPFRDDLRDID